MDILKGEKNREVNLLVEETKQGESRLLKGVEIYRVIAHYYRTQEELGQCHTIADLGKVKFTGDQQLRAFMNGWRKACNEAKSHVSEAVKEEMFMEQIQKSQVMANDVVHYRRLNFGDPDKTRAYLEGLVWKYLDRNLVRSNRDQEESAYNGVAPDGGIGQALPVAATPLEGSSLFRQLLQTLPLLFQV